MDVNIDVVIVGHVDHGKSTLIGRLLYDSETLPEDKLDEIQIILEEYRKQFQFAYFLDSFEEEFKEERTIDTTRVMFKGRNYYTIIDVPGHTEFIKNMLTGACHAQIASLVVSASDGIQEQTGRHAFLIHMLGIKTVLVAINKMDLVDYSQAAFEKIKDETANLLASLGFSVTVFVPISAIEGDNIYTPSERMDWYHGPTLVQALDETEPEAASEKPLRFVVQDVYHLDAEKVTVGRIECGTMRKGEELVFQPSGVRGKVHKIIDFPEEVTDGKAGDSIGIVVGYETRRGDVGGHIETPPKSVDRFLGEVVLIEGTLKRGDVFSIKCGTNRGECLVEEIRERINSETGEVIEENSTEVSKNEAATVVFKTPPMVVDNFSEIPQLGRFVLTRDGRNVALGIVLESMV